MRVGLSAKGLTLLEVLITVSLFIVVGLAVYSTVYNGLKIWQRLNKTYVEENVGIFFEKIAADLKNSFKYKDIDFIGKEDSVQFATVVVFPGQSPALVKGPGRVLYSFNPKEKKLIKQKMSLSDIYREAEGVSQELFNEVESVKFRYYYFDAMTKEYLWTDEWLMDYSPLAVRVELALVYEHNVYEFRKTVDIPAGGEKK